MLRTVARYADNWNTMIPDAAAWSAKRDVLHAHCSEVGRDPKAIATSLMLPLLPDMAATELADRVRPFIAAHLDMLVVNLPNPLHPSVLEELADAFAGL